MAVCSHHAVWPLVPTRQPFQTHDDTAAEPREGRRIPPPRCVSCAAIVRPGVVWFGEALPEAALTAAVEAATACDVALTIGTSGVVYPAAEIPRIAARSGATVIQVDPRPTPLDRVCAINLRGTAAEFFRLWSPPRGRQSKRDNGVD